MNGAIRHGQTFERWGLTLNAKSSIQTNELLEQLSSYALLRNEQRRNQIKERSQRLFDFGIGDPLEETPAFIREALAKAIPEVSQYPLAQGAQEFRVACAQWVKRRFGVEIDPSTQILSSNGSKEAIFHVPQTFLCATSAKRIVVAPDPGFPVYKSGTLLAGGICFEAALKPENGYVFQPESIPSELLPHVVAAWISYPHNPTGAQISRNDALRIYEWSRRHNILLLSDECYVDMYFPGAEAPCSFLEISASEKFEGVLSFQSLSKRSGMTGFRSGFVAGDERYVSLFKKLRPHIGLATPTFIQKAASLAWSDDKHVAERNKIFMAKRRKADAFLEKHGFKFVPSDSTFYVWIEVPKAFQETHKPLAAMGLNSQDSSGELYCQGLARHCGIVASPGDALGQSSGDFFRLALVPTVEELGDALAVWEKWIQSGYSL